ncbi:MAG TPA: nucleotide disphospho-sugar-binding domain-containing protein [Solirubrobacterales bacterium]
MSAGLRVIVGAVGLAGHTLPALALAGELRSRGHEVLFCGFARWRATAEGLGLRFSGSERAIAEPPDGTAAAAEPALADTVRGLVARIGEFEPDVVVGDALTLTPSLAAEVTGTPRATLFPEVYPLHAPGLPFFSLGLLPARTRLGAAAWRAAGPALRTRLPSTRWLAVSQRELNRDRVALGLAPRADPDAADPRELVLVATLPQLEYERAWPPGVHVVGPIGLDLPHPPVALPPGDDPLVLVAPSTVKDPDGRLVHTALAALGQEPVRVLVTLGGRGLGEEGPPPANAVVVDWVDYAQAMAAASLVVCHGNHGTVVKALAEGVPVLVSPAMPDDAEHGARVAWSGAGRMIPAPLLGAGTLRSVARTMLAEPRFAERAGAIAAWAREHDGPARAAELVERHAIKQ